MSKVELKKKFSLKNRDKIKQGKKISKRPLKKKNNKKMENQMSNFTIINKFGG